MLAQDHSLTYESERNQCTLQYRVCPAFEPAEFLARNLLDVCCDPALCLHPAHFLMHVKAHDLSSDLRSWIVEAARGPSYFSSSFLHQVLSSQCRLLQAHYLTIARQGLLGRDHFVSNEQGLPLVSRATSF